MLGLPSLKHTQWYFGLKFKSRGLPLQVWVRRGRWLETPREGTTTMTLASHPWPMDGMGTILFYGTGILEGKINGMRCLNHASRGMEGWMIETSNHHRRHHLTVQVIIIYGSLSPNPCNNHLSHTLMKVDQHHHHHMILILIWFPFYLLLPPFGCWDENRFVSMSVCGKPLRGSQGAKNAWVYIINHSIFPYSKEASWWWLQSELKIISIPSKRLAIWIIHSYCKNEA